MPGDGPILHHQHPIRLHCQRQVVQHGDDGVGAGEATEQTGKCHLMWRVEVGGGLVEQQYRGSRGECARQQHALPFALDRPGRPNSPCSCSMLSSHFWKRHLRAFLQAVFIASNIQTSTKYLDI